MRQPRTILSRRPVSADEYFGGSQAEPAARGPLVRLLLAAAEGLLPLVILLALLGLFLEATIIGRVFATPHGIAALQRTELLTAGVGLIIALSVFLTSAVRTLQGVRERQKAGEQMEARVTLIVLALTVIVALVPLLIALASPQHPAP